MKRSDPQPAAPTKGEKKRPLWRWLVNLGVILALFVFLHQWRTNPMASGEAPSLTGRLIDGGHFDLGQLRGQPVLVHFWAVWCPVCKMNDQDIDSIAQDFPVISVAMQSGGPREIAGYMTREGLAFPVIADRHGELATSWGVPGVPATFIVDTRGQIRFSTLGYSTETGLRGRLWAAEKLD